MFDDEVEHWAATVGPGAQMQGDAIRGNFDESGRFGNDRFRALGTCVEHVRRIAGSNSKGMTSEPRSTTVLFMQA